LSPKWAGGEALTGDLALQGSVDHVRNQHTAKFEWAIDWSNRWVDPPAQLNRFRKLNKDYRVSAGATLFVDRVV
jgi:hypothetical protein